MRILHVCPSFFPASRAGGPPYTAYRLCKELADQGNDVEVLTSNFDDDELTDVVIAKPVALAERLSVRYFEHRDLPLTTLRPRLMSAGLLRALPAAVRKADVVHLHGVYTSPTIPLLLACRLLDTPLVWTPRGGLQRWEGTGRARLKAAWEHVCRAALTDRCAFHVTGEKERADSAVRMPGTKFSVIPNGIDLPPHEMVPVADRRELSLLFIGRLHPIKGIENLLQACAAITIPWSLRIAGAGDPDYAAGLNREADRLQIANRVTFSGFVRGEAKAAALRDADVVVVPSHVENFAIVIAEALAGQTPVIASRGAPWPELEARGCGYWVDNSPKSLSDAIMRMASAPRAEMGKRGRAWMEQDYSWSSVARRMTELYVELGA